MRWLEESSLEPEIESRVKLLDLKNQCKKELDSVASEGQSHANQHSSEQMKERDDIQRKTLQENEILVTANKEFTKLIEKTRIKLMIGSRDREPIHVLRQALVNYWRSEKMAADRNTKQDSERQEKLTQIKASIEARRLHLRNQREEQKNRMAEAELKGDVSLQNILIQQKQYTDMMEMELNQDRKDLKIRMQKQTAEAHEAAAESNIRQRAAEAMVQFLQLGFRQDDLDRKERKLFQEAKLIRNMPAALMKHSESNARIISGSHEEKSNTSVDSVWERRLVDIQNALNTIKAEKVQVSTLMRNKKSEADAAQKELDSHLVLRMRKIDAALERRSNTGDLDKYDDEFTPATEIESTQLRNKREQIQRRREMLQNQHYTTANMMKNLDMHRAAVKSIEIENKKILRDN